MVLCQILFIVGGGLYTEGCRYVISDNGFEVSEAVTVSYMYNEQQKYSNCQNKHC